MSKMPRVADIVLPILRADLPNDVTVQTWGADIDYREFPIINIRSVGGVRHLSRPFELARPVIEMTAYTAVDIGTTEELYSDALEVLFQAVRTQRQTDAGYLHSIKETMGMTQFSSLYQDSWRVQGLIQLGVRPAL